MGYHYESHVKIVGIIEIVLQVLWSLVAFALIMLLIFGASLLTQAREVSISDFGSQFNSNDAANAISGIFIAGIIILVIVVAFNAWLVHLVFTGGQKKNATRLIIWYIIQSILLTLTIITQLVAMFSGNTWYFIILGLIFVFYRVYAIHVVRCFAAELNSSFQTSA